MNKPALRVNVLWLLLFFLGLAAGIPAAAEEENALPVCRITLEGSTSTASSKIAVQVNVTLEDEELRGHDLYLSYHIYSPNGDLLLFEGDRTRLTTWAGPTIQNIPVYLDLSVIEPVAGKKHLVVSFDIVDASGNYWFGDSPGVDLQSDTVRYDGTQLMKLKESAQKALRRPVALLINLLLAAGALLLCFRIKKARIFR